MYGNMVMKNYCNVHLIRVYLLTSDQYNFELLAIFFFLGGGGRRRGRGGNIVDSYPHWERIAVLALGAEKGHRHG